MRGVVLRQADREPSLNGSSNQSAVFDREMWGDRFGSLRPLPFSRRAIGLSGKLIAVNGLFEQPRLHGSSCHPFRDLARSSGLPPIIGRGMLRYLSVPSPNQRLLPFHFQHPLRARRGRRYHAEPLTAKSLVLTGFIGRSANGREWQRVGRLCIDPTALSGLTLHAGGGKLRTQKTAPAAADGGVKP